MDTHRGRVREWHRDDGWGVVEAPGVDDPVWVHYSVVEAPPGKFRELHAGAEVEFTAERAEQDGFHWRAVRIKE